MATYRLGSWMFVVAALTGACKAEPKASAERASAAKVTAEHPTAAERAAADKVAADKAAADKLAADKAAAEQAAADKAAAEVAKRSAALAAAEQAAADRADREEYQRAVLAVMATDPPLMPLPVQYEPDNSLPDKMGRRIRFRLRALSKAPIALTQIIHVPHDDGSSEVFALYQFSRYEECVRGYATRLEGRKQCSERSHTRLMRCVGGGVVWASFAPPSPDTPAESGGTLKVQTMPIDPRQCTFEAKEMIAGDLDEDGKLELMLTLLEADEPPQDNRGMWNHTYDMTFYLLPSGLAPEAVLRSHVAEWYAGNSERGLDPESPIELRDVNRDGRRDLVEYELADLQRCNREETAPDDLGEGELNPCLHANRAKVIYPYTRANKWSPAPLAWLEALLARVAR